MSLNPKTIPASRLSTDPALADWLFEQAGIDTGLDPLEILLQAEADGDFVFHKEDGVQYPHFAPSFN